MDTNVKEVKHLKGVFYKNISAEGGAMLHAINKANDTDVILHSQTTKLGRMWGYTNTANFLKLLEKNNGLYEVITKFPHKVYFDIDEDEKQENVGEYIEKVKHIILTYFPNAEMAISGSNTETKTSLHIILNNYTIHNEAERIYMKQLVKYISVNVLSSFDWKVYTKNRNMKCINQGKLDGRLQEIIENTDYKSHCITSFLNDYCLPFPALNYEIEESILIEKSNSTFDLGELPKMVLSVPEHIDYNEMTVEQALQMLPLDTKKFAHTYTHLVARFCFYNKIGFEEFLSWLQNKHTDLKLVKDKWAIHWSKLGKFPPVSIDRIKTILCSFYPHFKKDKCYRDFVETFNLPEPNISLIETIDQTCFNNNNKYNVFNIGMGGGKTAQTIDYLKYETNFLWIAPNIALASNTTNRFEEKDIDVTNYQRITTKDKKNGLLNNETKLIICLNSLHYLTTTTYKVLIIDEIETLLDKFLGDFIEQGKAQLKIKIWNKFIELIRSAEKVIFLDAFITSKTTNFIKSIEGSLIDVLIYKRIVEPQTRIIKYCDNFELTLNEIITKIKNGSKIFIFYPYKNQNSNVFSMEQVFNVIKEKTSKNGIFYNADVDDNIKKELKNVNKTWENYDFVITNNILTCGVNYENLDFDYKYLFIASFNTPRDIIQVSYRARHLSSGIINVCYLGKMNSTTTWLNDCDKFKCSIYNDLYKSILIEKKAPIKRAFQLFCVKAHYKQEVSQKKIDEALEKEITALLTNQQVGYFYDTIEYIDLSQAEIISQHCVAQEATMYEKICLKKYYFNKMFLDDAKDVTFKLSLCGVEVADPLMLSYTWNEKYNFFFVKMREILSNKDNIFNKIAQLNNIDNLFPTDVKKTKLNDEILDQIFKEFSFKFISRSSHSAKILKEIYNTFFGSFIISTMFDANKHAIYFINDPVVPHIYGFCKKYLILDQETNIVYQNLENDEHSATIEI